MLKKFFAVTLVLMLAFSLSGCGSNEPTEVEPQGSDGKYEDGIYFAQEDEFVKDWKYLVTIEVKDGEIVSADWNGANINAGPDKDTVSKSGGYPMVENGGAQAPWHEQAEKAEAYLVETQDPTQIAYNDDAGHTDDIAGVSIHVIEFFELAEKALANGPVGRGPYKDGAYFAEEDDFVKDFKYSASLTVINGNIVAADWDGLHTDGSDKDTMSIEGEYPMVENGGAQAPWHEQAEKAAAYLLEIQDPTAVVYSDDAGHTDDIAGVSIHVIEFFELAEKALEEAK
ncbi:MAG: FMN-binding protein [Desulfitibacter sp. BRH_c19]|nr:MAG: FMN-binding protein [Desulfitibacter sp. BRH_c19]